MRVSASQYGIRSSLLRESGLSMDIYFTLNISVVVISGDHSLDRIEVRLLKVSRLRISFTSSVRELCTLELDGRS
jgi:K+ transporter